MSFLFFVLTNFCFGQKYILKNEELIFSFQTKTGKKMVLAKDKQNKYIIYRYGNPKKIELEYPEKNLESWGKFTYSYYSRGGGKANAAMELYSLFFQIDNFDYSVYKDYYSEDESFKTGILITNLLNNKITNIKGNYNTIKGTFYNLKEDNLIKEDQERIR